MSSKSCCPLCEGSTDNYPKEDIVDLGRKGRFHKACLYKRSRRYENTVEYGRSDGLPRFSCEIETASRRESVMQQTLALLYHGYISTSDGTVDTEYKSPQYLSLASALPAFKEIDKWSRDAINAQCGSHIHVDCPAYGIIEPAVFSDLLYHLERYRYGKTERFWGRDFCDWALPQCDPDNRYSAINLASHYPTIEWRLPRFHNYEQYVRVVRFVRKVTAYVQSCCHRTQGYYGPTWEQMEDINTMSDEIMRLYRQYSAGV